MSGSTGTGAPLTFRCSKCKVGRDFRNDSKRGTNWHPTGRIIESKKKGAGLARIDQFRKAEYWCDDCGWTGWSRHETVIARALKKQAQIKKGR